MSSGERNKQKNKQPDRDQNSVSREIHLSIKKKKSQQINQL